jgi:hypothetical protein
MLKLGSIAPSINSVKTLEEMPSNDGRSVYFFQVLDAGQVELIEKV